MSNVEKFRPGSALVSGAVLIVFFTGFIIQSAIYGGDIALTTLICSAGIISAYLLFLRPYVLIFDEGIKIVNPTKEITVTWDLVDQIDTKYSMSISVGDQIFHAWAAPAPSRTHQRRLHKSDLLPGADPLRRVGDSSRSDSGVCAHIAKLRKKSFVGVSNSKFEVRSDVRILALDIALIVIALAIAIF
jgi:hypothetical protein